MIATGVIPNAPPQRVMNFRLRRRPAMAPVLPIGHLNILRRNKAIPWSLSQRGNGRNFEIFFVRVEVLFTSFFEAENKSILNFWFSQNKSSL
ncbi:MAG TPA: hypothetical protein VN856_20995 [Mycobacterium sp.]|uniref:hypothetical protein n=1 Tax=Mycobacterium sp. TaxID=1785 RepID=UPI002C43E191|nr:hypothetical protein [Mycobacterium sp.]HXO82356.1 hypothetical protein [Mycobacterium sp.]